VSGGVTGPGAELARRYHDEVVAPLLARHLPAVPYAAGRLGAGSDVLGLDDATSRDHDWGLRLTLLVAAGDEGPVDALLERELPAAVDGLPTRFALTWDPVVRHRVEVTTLEAFTTARLGVDATRDLDLTAWLSLTGQAVLEVVAGPVFADADGRLAAVRRRLAWYPDDLALHLVAVDWARFDEELPFVGRTGERGDDLGSRTIAARLAGVLVHLGFLLERRWPPYPKWRGTVFAGLPSAGAAVEHLDGALRADRWQDREAALCAAADVLLDVQRRAGQPSPPDGEAVQPFHDRPFRAVRPEVGRRLLDAVRDPDVRALPRAVGSVEQWSDSVALLTDPGLRRAVSAPTARPR
jgi:hypothetical protein